MVYKVLLSIFSIVILLILLPLHCTTNEKDVYKEGEDLAGRLPFLNLHDTVKYIGMQACRACHEDKYQTFIQTGMGRSFGLAKPGRSIANFHDLHPVYDPYLDFYYLPFWENNTLMLKEFRLKDGDTVYSRLEKIDYIIGSGHHTNSHIFSINGFLYQAPITWYAQAEKWDLPPGYEDGNNTRFKRIIGIECLSCHNAYPDFESMSLNKFHQVPMGIDCERCHGPGELHVLKRSFQQYEQKFNDTDYTIVNPAKLPLEFQIDLCQRCHLQGNAVLKIGKTFTDFRPGMRLFEVMDVFLPEYKDDNNEFIMASHAERMQLSNCFTESKSHSLVEPLNCMSCHNPHISVQLTHKEYFINSCMSCHQITNHLCTESIEKRQLKENNCISCHMPRSGTIDIPHVTITDHFIRVPDKNDLESKPVKDSEFLRLKSMTREKDQIEPETFARAYLFYFEKFSPDIKFLNIAKNYLEKTNRKKHYKIWIHYYYLIADYVSLTRLSEELNIKPDDALTAYHIGQSYFNLGKMEKAVLFFQFAIELEKYNLEYVEKLGITYMHNNQIDKAEDIFKSVISYNPYMELSLNNLGYIYLITSRPSEAMRYIDKALELNPDYIHALLNKAKLYIYFDNTMGATNKLKRILEIDPDNTNALELLELIRN